MKKAIIITGRNGSGKTKKALEIAGKFEDTEVIRMHYDYSLFQNPFAYSICDLNTKLIIIDDIKEEYTFISFFSAVNEGIFVNKKAKKPFRISPEFLFICDQSISYKQLLKNGASFHHRFDIIDCDKKDIPKSTSIFHDPTEIPLVSKCDSTVTVDVFIIDESGMHGLAFYDLQDKEWRFHTDTVVDYNEKGNETKWKWYYPQIILIDAFPELIKIN
ncbi:MAG: hypothetical protein ACOYOV_11090 [Bacteroidales bacterium]